VTLATNYPFNANPRTISFMSEKPNPRVRFNMKTGSVKIVGTVDIVDEEGKIIKTTDNVKFCGCKLSKDYPYCDGSHRAITGDPKPTIS